MDLSDEGRIHSVIAGQAGAAAVDYRTGDPALRDVDETSAGGAVFIGGSMRRVAIAGDGDVYLRERMGKGHPLARIKATGPAAPISRSLTWGLARQHGLDPVRWKLTSTELLTFGGETFNILLAALFARLSPKDRFAPSSFGVRGPVTTLGISLDGLRAIARSTQAADNLPLDVAGRFVNPSQFMSELSPVMTAREKRASIPWPSFNRWLDMVEAIDIDGK